MQVNPIAENADKLKDQAFEENTLCDIAIPAYADDDQFVQDIVSSITGSSCSITACDQTLCDACNETSCDSVVEISDFRNCNCDLVVTINSDHGLVLSTVAYKDEVANITNDIKLLALFEKFSGDDGVDGVKNEYGLPLNNPKYPAIVPQFTTMSEFTQKMGQVISNFTGIDTEIIMSYEDSTFLLEIDFEKAFGVDVSFEANLELGDMAELAVEDSRLSVAGLFSIKNAIAVKLAPNDSDSLKVVATLNDHDCTGPDLVDLQFNITVDGNKTGVTVPCVNGTENRYDAMAAALLNAFGENETYTVSLVGTSSLTLAFAPFISELEIEVEDDENKYGIKNDKQTKAPFHILLGKTEIEAALGLAGSATVSASAGGIEVAAEVEASVGGTLNLFAGTQEPIPLNQWLSKLKAARDSSNEFHDPNFASAALSVDGDFEASVGVKLPFELDVPVSIEGGFVEPFTLDLLDLSTLNTAKPNIALTVDLPNIGDLGSLSFADIVALLDVAMDMLVGDGDDDSVESCSGGLLGKEVRNKSLAARTLAF